MKQLYSAGLLSAPAAAPGRPAPAVKAASAGVRPEDVRAALPFTAYAPPPARADAAATAVYAVTRALPHGLLDDFTFSTYEPDPLASTARLVGHDTGSADWELPAGCYEGPAVGINPATGKKSDLKVEIPFAA